MSAAVVGRAPRPQGTIIRPAAGWVLLGVQRDGHAVSSVGAMVGRVWLCSVIQDTASVVQAAASPLPWAKPRLWGRGRRHGRCGERRGRRVTRPGGRCARVGHRRLRPCATGRTVATNGSPARPGRSRDGARATHPPHQDHAFGSICLCLHRRDRVAKYGEINRLAQISAGRECGQTGKVSPGGEPDQLDPLSTAVPQPVNLSPESV